MASHLLLLSLIIQQYIPPACNSQYESPLLCFEPIPINIQSCTWVLHITMSMLYYIYQVPCFVIFVRWTSRLWRGIASAWMALNRLCHVEKRCSYICENDIYVIMGVSFASHKLICIIHRKLCLSIVTYLSRDLHYGHGWGGYSLLLQASRPLLVSESESTCTV